MLFGRTEIAIPARQNGKSELFLSFETKINEFGLWRNILLIRCSFLCSLIRLKQYLKMKNNEKEA